MITAVYGGANGIGKAIADRLYDEGNDVHIYDKVGGTQVASLSPLVPEAYEFDEVYITIGQPGGGEFDDENFLDQKELARNNFEEVVLALHHARAKASRECSYVLTSSIAAHRSDPKGAIYAASKAAVEVLGRNLAREWRPSRVNVVAPGPTLTEQFKRNVSSMSQQFEAARAPGYLPMLEPEEVAHAMISVARIPGMTAQTIVVDKGGTAAARRD